MPTPKPNLDSLFQAVLEIETPEAQAAFLLRACGDDVSLRTDVERLLKSHQNAGSFLEQPAAEYFAAGHIDARKRVEKPVDVTLTSRSDLDSLATLQTEVNDCPPATASDQRSHEMAGELIAGKYQLIELIGEGGMGSVWRAKQSEPIKRFVAVKLIKAGRDSRELLSRFNIERQALALMEHPNIAKVLDGGLHQNRPYFVMELVKGLPITEYCDKCRLTPLSRLELFVFVCQAIQHAHHKGIIHRDIKPSNVLVALYDERPVVKVIDFGVAKATAEALIDDATLDTAMGTIVGTPQYMSPEQATLNNLDIDTRSDIYSLGVLLYELLTGSPPFSRLDLEKRGLLEMLRIVREEEPPRPSQKLSTADALPTLSANRGTEPKTLTGLLRNELDWIVMKALEKDRTRRYETANGFSADVLRYLSGETVQAHPTSTSYRLEKFVRKNRGQVIAGSLVILALAGGMIGTSLGLLKAEARRVEADQARAREKERADGEEYAKIEAESQKKKAIAFRDKVLDALRATTETDVLLLIGERKELSANQKACLEAIAGRWQSVAEADESDESDEQSRAIRADGHYQVARLWQRLGRLDDARPDYEQSVAVFQQLVIDFPEVPEYRLALVNSYISLGKLLWDEVKRTEAEAMLRKAQGIAEKLTADFPAVFDFRSSLASCHINLGKFLLEDGKREDAEEQYNRALALLEKLAVEFPSIADLRLRLVNTHENLANLLGQVGRRAEQLEHGLTAQRIVIKMTTDFPAMLDDDQESLASRNNLGKLLSKESITEFRHGLATADNNVGKEFREKGEQSAAAYRYRMSQAILEKLTSDFPTVPAYRKLLANCHNNQGILLADEGKREKAEEQHRKALALQEKLAEDFPAVLEFGVSLGGTCCNLGNLAFQRGNPAGSLKWFAKAIDTLNPIHEKEPLDVTARRFLSNSHLSRGGAYAKLKQFDKALDDWGKAFKLISN